MKYEIGKWYKRDDGSIFLLAKREECNYPYCHRDKDPEKFCRGRLIGVGINNCCGYLNQNKPIYEEIKEKECLK